ncbi:SUMF1/EgtB/PvdO family nonheme iron enzyme [Peterkaempfera sp. SMS 1(5)a]|uniref:SUMF1/EgtB/PvdO family nonheme iron enzyme n=1 Tax=Peterkaempfera podocarpi TaxID=3232308 RepID=UPI00366ED134
MTGHRTQGACCGPTRGTAGYGASGTTVPLAPPPPRRTPPPGGDAAERPDAAAVDLPGGTFLMGDPFGEGYHADGEGPSRPVTVMPFRIDTTAVTNGVLHEADAGPLAPGPRTVTLTATAVPGLRWKFGIAVDGAESGRLDSVHQLIGMAPFQGISVGVDRRSPVSWPVYKRHGAFRCTGRLRAVTYTPGEPAPDDPAAVAQALKEAAASFE